MRRDLSLMPEVRRLLWGLAVALVTKRLSAIPVSARWPAVHVVPPPDAQDLRLALASHVFGPEMAVVTKAGRDHFCADRLNVGRREHVPALAARLGVNLAGRDHFLARFLWRRKAGPAEYGLAFVEFEDFG